jgi:hypothetical protein
MPPSPRGATTRYAPNCLPVKSSIKLYLKKIKVMTIKTGIKMGREYLIM